MMGDGRMMEGELESERWKKMKDEQDDGRYEMKGRDGGESRSLTMGCRRRQEKETQSN